MGTIDLPKKPLAPNPVKPDAPSDSGLWELPPPEDLRQEECARIMQLLKGKLPADLLERPGLMDNLEQKIGELLERHCQALYSRCAAPGDEAANAEFRRYTADEIAGLLNSLGGAGRFNTGEIEPRYAPRHENDLEAHTNKLLRGGVDAAAFAPADDAFSVVKCVFRDNALKPRTVVDLKLVINIPDTALIGPELYQYALGKYVITDLAAAYIAKNIDKENGNFNNFNDFNVFNIDEFIEKISGDSAEIAADGFALPADSMELIRSRGFSSALNALCALLNEAGMGYQFMQNNQNGRELVINEYEDTDPPNLPDERFRIRFACLDQARLIEERQAYDARIGTFQKQLRHLEYLVTVMYRDSKSIFKVNDFEDLSRKHKSRIKALRKDTVGEPAFEGAAKVPDEFSLMRARLAGIHERIRNTWEFLYPVERRLLEERLAGLEREYALSDFLVNPHHLQPGLALDIEITSIKQRKTTLDSMSRVLREFSGSVYAGFQEAALAVLGRRKITLPAKASRRR